MWTESMMAEIKTGKSNIRTELQGSEKYESFFVDNIFSLMYIYQSRE